MNLSDKDIENIAGRLEPVTDEKAEALFVALAIKFAIDSVEFQVQYGGYGRAVLTQYAVNSRDKED